MPRLIRDLNSEQMVSRPRDEEGDFSKPLRSSCLEIVDVRRGESIEGVRRQPETEPFMLAWCRE